jgi:hypothetical protein
MTPTDPASSAEVVLDLFRDQCRWMVEGRADLLEGILDDSFTAQHITGYVSPDAATRRSRLDGQLRSSSMSCRRASAVSPWPPATGPAGEEGVTRRPIAR